EQVIVPLTVAILVLLFVVQRQGTSFIGGIFGPVMLVWFIAIALLGIAGIARAPAILAALSPFPAITYLWNAGPVAFAVIGGAFLAVTGGGALYADMGPFGRLPVRVALFGCALPPLPLYYFRPSRVPLPPTRPRGKPFLSAGPAVVALWVSGAGDARDRDRLAGHHHWRLFTDPASNPARLPAPHEHHTYRRSRARPDLHTVRKLDAGHRHARGGDRLRLRPVPGPSRRPPGLSRG